MLEIGVQSRNIVEDPCPEKGFRMLKDAGFSCTDFSLNSYLTNKDLYEGKVNAFFSQSIQELEQFFSAHIACSEQHTVLISGKRRLDLDLPAQIICHLPCVPQQRRAK